MHATMTSRTDNVHKVNSAPKLGEERESSDESAQQFGWLCCVPTYLQRFNTPRWFTAFFCFFVIIQGFTVTGMTGVVIPALEKRYHLSSVQSGLIPGTYDIASAVGVIPLSYYGDRAHKPRWIGIGSLLLGSGALVFALPQFISGTYHGSGQQRLEYCGVGLNHSVYESTDCTTDDPSVYSLFLIGQILIAFGALPVFTMGVAFMDEIAGPKRVHLHLAALYISAAVGPAIGFFLGSIFMSQYVDLGAESPPDQDDPSFVGRWWAGFVLVGVLSVVASIPLLAYPKVLPKTAWIMAEKRSTQRGTGACARSTVQEEIEIGDQSVGIKQRLIKLIAHAKNMIRLSTRMLFTGVFIFNSLGAAAEAFAVSGISPFINKFIQAQFRTRSSTASLLTGGALVPGVGGGIFVSSLLLKKWNVRGVQLARFAFIIAVIASVFTTAFLVHCSTPPLVGSTVAYPNSSVKTADRCKQPLSSSCMASCGCVSERYDPVCGSDKRTYLTPCLAGCHDYLPGSSTKNRVYYNCSCITEGDGNTASGGTAKTGICTNSCGLLPLFIILLLLIMFFTFMNNIPAIEVILQSVPAEHRTLATGVQWVFVRCLGNAPAPIFVGYLLDRTCNLWQLKCCKHGNCWEYDNPAMSRSIFFAIAGCKILSAIFFFLSWRFYIREQQQPTEIDVQPLANMDSSDSNSNGADKQVCVQQTCV